MRMYLCKNVTYMLKIFHMREDANVNVHTDEDSTILHDEKYSLRCSWTQSTTFIKASLVFKVNFSAYSLKVLAAKTIIPF